ncbi:MAG: hypothetical protein H0W25_05470 [Acidimicrobiia bacterium]|nr:hypothetical protein [Acidimicrobiia bacterium]
MSWSFGPDDETQFFAERDRLVAAFEATAGGRGCGWVASQILEFKWGYLGGDLARWGPADVEEILLELYPRKVVLERGDESEVIAGFEGLLVFLASEGILAEDQAGRVIEAVRSLSAVFVRAMADESRWGVGKRLLGGASAEGVDVTDQAGLERWMTDFNQKSFAERGRILGPSPVDAAAARMIGPLPPVVLAPEAELAAAAAETVWVRRVTGLAQWVGDGKALTDRGNLKLADAKALVESLSTGDRVDEVIGDHTYRTRSASELPGLDLAFRLAVESGVLAVDGRRLVAGERADALDDPLTLAYGVLLAMLQRVGPVQHRWRVDTFGWGWYAADIDAELPLILVGLYRDRSPAPVEELAEDMWSMLLGSYDLDDLDPSKLDHHRRLVFDATRLALHRLEEVGVLAVTGVTEAPAAYGGVERSGGDVDLTSLGFWAVQRFASRITEAPVAGALADLEAPDLLHKAGDLPDALATAELDAWVARRPGTAAEKLVAALPEAGETERALAFRALLRIGASATDAAAALALHPVLAAYVTVWRVDTLVADPAEMDCSADPERFVRLLAAVLDLWGPHALSAWLSPAAGASGVPDMLGRAWRVRLPETDAVLATLGATYPDKYAAKAARTALHPTAAAAAAGSATPDELPSRPAEHRPVPARAGS